MLSAATRQIYVSCHSYKSQLSQGGARSRDSTTSSLGLMLNQTACCQQWSLVWTAKPIFGAGKANLDCVTISGLTRKQKWRSFIHKRRVEYKKYILYIWLYGKVAVLGGVGRGDNPPWGLAVLWQDQLTHNIAIATRDLDPVPAKMWWNCNTFCVESMQFINRATLHAIATTDLGLSPD